MVGGYPPCFRSHNETAFHQKICQKIGTKVPIMVEENSNEFRRPDVNLGVLRKIGRYAGVEIVTDSNTQAIV